MPEIKNVFRSGIMNKDDDERIIPNGQYRDAMNIEVATSEDSDVGTVQNILGNFRVDNLPALSTGDFKSIGAIADEKNDVLYWFVTGSDSGGARIDAIIEYHNDGQVTPILVDRNSDVLKFDKNNIITGINIIDNLLFWTDDVNEPKKINIDTLKLNSHTDLSTHSNMYVNEVSVGPITEDHITVIRKKPSRAPKVIFKESILKREYRFGGINGGPIDISDGTGQLPIAGDTINSLIHVANRNYFPFEFEQGDQILLSRDDAPGNLPQNYELKLEVETIITNAWDSSSNTGVFEFDGKILEISNTIPANNSFQYNAQKVTEEDVIFERDFIRFATRYKYADGEYSAFSPFTQPVFLAGSYGFHPTKDPHNLGMSNKTVSLELRELIPTDTPDDVVQLDILFKKEDSTVVYSVDSIKPDDPVIEGGSYNNWNAPIIINTLSVDYEETDDTTADHEDFDLGYTGTYSITTENIYAALPENQILRPWDNVPRKALSQEITANRLVYGNYIQNYNLRDFNGAKCSTDIIPGVETRQSYDNAIIDFSTGKPSIKAERTYYLGVVYGDEYGRETPVLTGKNSSIKVPFDINSATNIFNGAAENSLRLKAKLQGPQPDFAYYYKYFIKQTTGEYYNLVVDRVYKSVQDQTLWLSLPSSDRNKLQEGDYFTIKKQSEIEEQVPVENKIKVIDISNEAPESIKFDFSTLGTGGGSSGDLSSLFQDSNGQPAEDVVRISIDKETWIETEFGANIEENPPETRYAMQFSILSGAGRTLSEMYFVSATYMEDAGTSGRYIFILRKKITAADSWVESSSGVLNSTLSVELFKIENKNSVEFEGRFFVKVASDAVTQRFLIPSINNISDFALTARAFGFYLADTSISGNITGGTMGIFNATHTWTNTTGNARTRTEEEWATALKFNTAAESSSGWFIDSAYFAAVQGNYEDITGGGWDAWYSGRMYKGNPIDSANQQVNGLEGIVEVDNIDSGTGHPYRFNTTIDDLPLGARHWAKYPAVTNIGLTDYIDYGATYGSLPAGQSHFTETYRATGPYEEQNTGKGIFMHLSFSSVGVDLHDGNFDTWNSSADSSANQPNFKENLQWILSSGIHSGITGTGVNQDPVGNNYSYFNANITAVGLEAHDGQFDPGYMGGPSAAAVVNSLTVGNEFKFEGDDQTVYTIQSVDVKYLYNHTTWNPVIRTDGGGSAAYPDNLPGNSVSEVFDAYRAGTATLQELQDKIVDFGRANNRRVCYIVQLDKDPRTQVYNPLSTADKDTFNTINFIDTYIEPGKNTIPTSPAVIETEAKEDQDLNIYFEISDALPRILDLTDGTGDSGLTSDYTVGAFGSRVDPNSVKGHMLAPVGSKVSINVSGTIGGMDVGLIDYGHQNEEFPEEDFWLKVVGWDGNIVYLGSPGLKGNANLTKCTNNYKDKVLTFWREDGSYTKAAIFSCREVSGPFNYVTKVELYPLVHNRDTGLSYYNCFSFGNGVESNRIRDDFNTPFIRNGVKASTVLEETYEEERRKYGLIYSGLYNSTSGINNLNQFIQAEKITKDINPVYGSIQKLYARERDLVTLCEDKVLQIFVNRDVLFNADGNQQLLATNNVLGQAQPFRGNYGISKNPESFASESFRAYFTDKQRGAVLRLSMDGLTPISDAGMSDYFRDHLKDGHILYGCYDAYKKDYNLSINFGATDDQVLNPGFDEGFSYNPQEGTEKIINGDFSLTTTTQGSNLIANGNFSDFQGWNEVGLNLGNEHVFQVLGENQDPASPLGDNPTPPANWLGSDDGTGAILFSNSVVPPAASSVNVGAQYDISGLNIPDGAEVTISWDFVLDEDTANVIASSQMTSVGTSNSLLEDAEYPDTKFKVTLNNGTSACQITHSEIANFNSGDYGTMTYSFTKTMTAGSTFGTTNSLTIMAMDLGPGNAIFVDNVSVAVTTQTLDNWTLNIGANWLSAGNVFFPGGSNAQQAQVYFDPNKKYRINANITTPFGSLQNAQNAKLQVNGITINNFDPPQFDSSSSPVYKQSGSVSLDTYLLGPGVGIEAINGDIHVNSISIKEIENYGGNVNFWNLNDSANTTDVATVQMANGDKKIAFTAAPKNTFLHQTLIKTNKVLDFDVDRMCRVKFNLTDVIGNGELKFRLYNEEGEGFEHIATPGLNDFTAIIGSDESSSFSEVFGFYVSSDNEFTGMVDNISLIIDSNNDGGCVSFNEKAKGWTSFKSFVPEVGISSVNQFYTMNLGRLWKHHVEQFDPTTNEEINRNTFYGVHEDSKVVPVLNSQPELVKHFNTLNYEGTQSRIDQLRTHDLLPSKVTPIGSNLADTQNIQAIPLVNNTQLDLIEPNNNIIITNLQGAEQDGTDVSDMVLVTFSDIASQDANGNQINYRFSFDFKNLDINPESHVFFDFSGDPGAQSSQTFSNGIYSIDFITQGTTPTVIELLIIHPFVQDGYSENVSIELSNFVLQQLVFTNPDDNQYYNLQTKDGWYVSNIHTNKQEGMLNEFIEKEGKWFNYIKGTEEHVDPAAFNFQGLGIASEIITPDPE